MSSVNLPGTVVGRRAGKPHTSMFLRMLVRAAVLRRGRAASALLAMVVAAAVATAMLNLYADVQAKLQREFRSYGANIVVVGKPNAPLPQDAVRRAEEVLALPEPSSAARASGHTSRGIVVPFAYVVARTADGQSVVVAGTDFDRVRRLNTWWKVSAWRAPDNPSRVNEGPASPNDAKSLQTPMADALVGVRAAQVTTPQSKPFDLSFQGKVIHVTPAGILQTGGAEDSRIYIALDLFERWSGLSASTLEIAAGGSPAEVAQQVQRLGEQFPYADVRPVRQVMEAEARVLGKTKAALLAAAALIVLTSALCVLSTLMGWVFDRRRDFAIMKALGASGRLINGFFAAEAAALGVIGALAGFIIGVGISAWIGRVNFHAPVVPRLSVLPAVLAGSVAVALLSAALPIALLRRVQPAMILRGE
jgi:putative ABC transport system permease protein